LIMLLVHVALSSLPDPPNGRDLILSSLEIGTGQSPGFGSRNSVQSPVV
jgi:hypothetical protein